MQFVRQENRSSGCGPACIAMLASRRRGSRISSPYHNAVEIIFGAARSRALHTSWRDLRRALRQLNISQAAKVKRCYDWNKIGCIAIVKCKVRKNGENWHWVILDGRSDVILYDPLKDKPGPIPSRYGPPFSYLEVF